MVIEFPIVTESRLHLLERLSLYMLMYQELFLCYGGESGMNHVEGGVDLSDAS